MVAARRSKGDVTRLTRTSSVAGIRNLSPTTLLAMGLGGIVMLLDGLAGPEVSLIGLLGIPPVIAAMRASPPETGVVGAFCLVLAALAGLTSDNFGSADHLTQFVVVAAGTAAGLWAAGLREDLERSRSAETMLAEAGTLLEDELDPSRRAQHVAKLAVPSLADLASVDLVSPDGSLERSYTAAVDRDLAAKFRRLRRRHPIDINGSHPIAEAVRSGQERLLQGLDENELKSLSRSPSELKLLRRIYTHETLIVPLRARGTTVGAIAFSLLEPDRHYDKEARLVARALAERCAMAIDNARVHTEQAHIASVLQRSLMPDSLPEIAGFELATRFMAAGVANQVGGDFFDVFRSGKESWTVVIGDVCGKGPEAAAMTALARHTIRATETVGSPPSEILAGLHDSIQKSDPTHRFCTAVLARVEQKNGRPRLELTIGGHPAPLVVHADGGIEAVGTPGTLLGGLDEPRLTDASTPIRAGESIVLFTDGLLEARDRSADPDPSWPARLLRNADGRSAERIADRLLETALKRQGGEPRDDIAIVVLRRLP